MKSLSAMIMIVFGVLIGFEIGVSQASAAHYQTVFPKFARGVWYQYVPKKGFQKIKLTKHYRSMYSHFWGYDKIILANKEFNSGKRITKPVWVKGGFFTATVATPDGETIMQSW